MSEGERAVLEDPVSGRKGRKYMNLMSIENISKSYSEKILLNNISLGIGEGDKIGVIGVNGTGKSTFLKIVAGVEEAEGGKLIIGSMVRIEYLSQNPSFDEQATVLEQIFKGSSPEITLLRKYESTLEKLNSDPNNEILQREILSLNHQMDAAKAWQLESEAKTILTKLGISNFDAIVGTLSGGQRKRIALASSLITPSDLLILDEPTNHIDNDTVEWLEQYLNKRKGALLMITHDRYFLDRVANRTIELHNGNLYSYAGNYSDFLEKKLEREELEQATERKRQNLYRKELAWIKRGAKARTTKQKARIDRFEKIQDQKLDVSSEKLEMSSVSTRLGKKIIELQNVTKCFKDKKFIDDFSYILLRDDRIGIIGPNGEGKSTLMNIISGALVADGGNVEVGETVKIGYFSQENKGMDESLRVIDYIKEVAEFLPLADGTTISASQMLERFLFVPAMQYTPISKLSGGERRRLYLLYVLMGAPNVLLLDEPTNDLDIQTLTILEDYIDDFNGAVIVVSHDRYFLDRVVNKIFSFEGNGQIAQYVGNYSDYQDVMKFREDEEKTVQNKIKNEDKKVIEDKKKDKPLKFTYKEQKEYEEIDNTIANKEEELENVNKKVNSAGSNFELLQELIAEQAKLEKELEYLMERWTYLNELAEQINNQK